MSDFFFDETGDIRTAPGGDIALTDSSWRDDAQQAYIRIKTQPGDFLMYPDLGADLDQLRGMPQSESTGSIGKQIIKRALENGTVFQGRQIFYKAIPTGPQTIRFDIYIVSNSQDSHILSIEQNLGVG